MNTNKTKRDSIQTLTSPRLANVESKEGPNRIEKGKTLTNILLSLDRLRESKSLIVFEQDDWHNSCYDLERLTDRVSLAESEISLKETQAGAAQAKLKEKGSNGG